MMKLRGLTRNQTELLTLVKAGGPDGHLDFDQLLDELSWTPTKEAAQFTIRALIKKGVLEKLPELEFRRSRNRICYRLTAEGFRVFDPRSVLSLEVGSSGSGSSEEYESIHSGSSSELSV